MAYDPFGGNRNRTKKQRTPDVKTFTTDFDGTEEEVSVTLTMWKATNPELMQGQAEGERLVELYVTGDREAGRDPIGFPPVAETYITFDEDEYNEKPESRVLLKENALRNGAMLECLQPRFAQERYTALEFVAMFATWPPEDWGKLWKWAIPFAGEKASEKNSKRANTKSEFVSPSQTEETIQK
jgi:hypothetical protein